MTPHLTFNLLTLFPEMFPGPLGHSLAGRALDQKIWDFQTRDIREFGLGKHKTVDDSPFGGGAGMVMRPDVIEAAITSLPTIGRLIYLSPRGRLLDQALVRDLCAEKTMTLLCGRYEGIDERVLTALPFEEISIGDYVLSGGEPAAMVLMDACIRLLPDVMGNAQTPIEESFSSGLLEYPHYTRPAAWTTHAGDILNVPDILVSGDHKAIENWRREQALTLTQARRPDLISKKHL
jgi:tRNA (guanine37-N1)-methyltransferase